MDSITIDVGDAEVSFGDIAVLLGQPGGVQPTAGVRAEDAAERADALSYELLVRVGGRVPRVRINDSIDAPRPSR